MRVTAESTSDSVTECGFVVGEVVGVLSEVPAFEVDGSGDSSRGTLAGRG